MNRKKDVIDLQSMLRPEILFNETTSIPVVEGGNNSGSSEMSNTKIYISNAKLVIGRSLYLVCAVFFVEALVLVIDGLSGRAPFMAVGASVLVAGSVIGVVGLVLSILVGLVAAYTAGGVHLEPLIAEKIEHYKRFFTSKEPEVQRRFLENTLASLMLVLFSLLTSIWCVHETSLAIETPIFSSVLSVLETSLLIGIGLILWPLWRRTAYLILFRLKKNFPPWITLIGFGSIFLAIGMLFTLATWKVFGRYLPWRPVMVFPAVVAMIPFLKKLHHKIAKKASLERLIRYLSIGLMLTGCVAAAILPRELAETEALLMRARGPLSASYGLFHAAIDMDGDGHISWMGGLDCAPFDPQINPSAWDIPGDGIDQDCDGEDCSTKKQVSKGKHNYPVKIETEKIPIIFITIDAVSALRMDLHGHSRVTMPNLTKRAEKSGVVFNWAFSEGPGSRISFPSLVTGLHNSEIKRKFSRKTMAPWEDVEHTMGTVFKDAGYTTEAVVPDSYFGSRFRWLYKGMGHIDKSAVHGKAGVHKNGDEVTSAALKRLDLLIKKEKRFFLWVHYTDAHAPHRLPEGVKPVFGRKPADIYDRELQLLDKSVDTLLEGIEEKLKGRKYAIALTADHGQAFDERHKRKHQDHGLYTAVTWVPLIFWSPLFKRSRIEKLASAIDVFPTLLNLTGIEVKGVSGDSLLPAILGESTTAKPIMQQFYLPEVRFKDQNPLKTTAVRHQNYVLYQRSRSQQELYDFKKDPLETNDLIEELPNIAKDLRAYRNNMLKWAYRKFNREHDK